MPGSERRLYDGQDGVVRLGIGGQHTLAYTASGEIVCWGNNMHGQCDPPVPGAPVLHLEGGLDYSLELVGTPSSPTDPLNPDTDGDGMPDGWEVLHGLDPLDPSDAGANLAGNRLNVSSGAWSCVYGYADNRLVSVSASGGPASPVFHDAAGNVTGMVSRAGVRLSLAWDTQGRLLSVATNGAPAESYAYDPLGRRVRTASGMNVVCHVYDGDRCVADLGASGNILRAYTWGLGVDSLLALTVYPSGAGATNTYHAVRDHLGSVCVLVDSTGATKEQYRYGAWGETQILNASGQPVPASSCGSRFLFHGGEYSEATGLYRFRARWYAPELGRWLSPDPIGLEGGLNLYEFCGNDPVNGRDPSGLVVSWAFVGVGALGNLGAYALGSWVGNRPITAGGVTGALVAGAIAGATAGIFVGDPSAAGVAAIAWGAFGGGFGGAVGGAIGSAIQQGIDQGDVCLNKVGHDALISGLGGALGGGITGRFLPESLWRAVSVSTLASAAVNTYDNIASQIQDALNRQASSYRNNPDYWDNLEKFGD